MEKMRVIDRRQFKAGYYTYHPHDIPNFQHHEYQLIKILSDDQCLVRDEETHDQA